MHLPRRSRQTGRGIQLSLDNCFVLGLCILSPTPNPHQLPEVPTLRKFLPLSLQGKMWKARKPQDAMKYLQVERTVEFTY